MDWGLGKNVTVGDWIEDLVKLSPCCSGVRSIVLKQSIERSGQRGLVASYTSVSSGWGESAQQQLQRLQFMKYKIHSEQEVLKASALDPQTSNPNLKAQKIWRLNKTTRPPLAVWEAREYLALALRVECTKAAGALAGHNPELGDGFSSEG